MSMHRIQTCLLGLLMLCACGAVAPDPQASPPVPLKIDATVVRIDLEGGFYGLVDNQKRRYDPGQLPPEFRFDGLAVRAILRLQPSTVTTRMWGEQVEVVHIERR